MSPRNGPIDHAAHFELAEQNELLARGLCNLGSSFNDWVVTICFYAAKHYTTSKMTSLTTDPGNHSLFLQEVANAYRPASSVYSSLRYLFDLSMNARYLPKIAKKYKNTPKYQQKAFEALEKLKAELGI